MPEIQPSELKRIPLFEDLTWQHLTAVADLFKREEYPAGYEVCRQGEPDHKAYFVRSGRLSVKYIDEEGVMWETTRLGPGDFFGQISLLLDEPHDNTIQAIDDAVLLSLDRNDFYGLIDDRPSLLQTLQPKMPRIEPEELEHVPLFEKLSRKERRSVADLFEPHEYQTGREICLQGQVGREAHYLKSGELRITRVDSYGVVQEIALLRPGSFFGQTSLLLGEPRDATVEVTRTAIVLSLAKDEFDELLEEHPAILRKLRMRPEIAERRRAPHFPWQYDDETVVVHLHKHNVTLQQQLALPGLIFLVGLIAFFYWVLNPRAILALLASVILILPPVPFVWYKVADNRNDHYVVTNKRVFSDERSPFGRERSGEASLLDVQDVQQVKEGRMAWLFDFGDLIIDTAAKRQLVIFRKIPEPDGVRNAIFEQRERALAWARAEERAAIREAMQIHFDLQAPPVRVAEPPSPPEERGFRLFPRLRVPLRIFPPLRHEEGDTITWRKHWIALLKSTLPPTGLIAAATIAAIVLASLSARIHLSLPPILVSYGVLMVFPVVWWIWQFDDWQNDTYHVTSTRIIDVEKRPFYGREERREADLQEVQNITMTVPGFLARLFKYGSVIIETAGAGAFTFDLVKDPAGVRAEISRRVEGRRRQLLRETAQRRRDELLEWFSVYDQIHHTMAHKAEQPPPPEEES
jgi:CRP-like cAMP-binding protein